MRTRCWSIVWRIRKTTGVEREEAGSAEKPSWKTRSNHTRTREGLLIRLLRALPSWPDPVKPPSSPPVNATPDLWLSFLGDRRRWSQDFSPFCRPSRDIGAIRRIKAPGTWLFNPLGCLSPYAVTAYGTQPDFMNK